MSFYLINVERSENDYNTGIPIIYGHFECDSVTDLPAQNQTTYKIGIGSTAHIIDTNAEYAITSAGIWYVQTAGIDVYTKAQTDALLNQKANAADVYTKTQTDTLLNAKQNALSSSQLDAVNSGINANCLQTIIDNGQKNLLIYRRPDNTLNGVTFTNNPDGSISLSGTSSAGFARQGTCLLSDLQTSMIGKTVRMTGGYNSSIRLRVFADAVSSTALYTDNGTGVNFTVTEEMITNPYQIRISVANGTDCTGVTIYPMLRIASLTGDNYMPYAPTNRQLYEMILALQ